MQNVYIDQELAAKEYLRRCKKDCGRKRIQRMLLSAGTWRILDAELLDKPVPMDLTMEDLLAETVSSLRDDGSSGDDDVGL